MTDRPTAVVGARACRAPTAAGSSAPHPAAHAGPRARRAQQGAVTAEAAMVIPVLVLTVVGLAWILTVAVAQVRVTDAAREVARLVARDETTGTAIARGREVAPPGAEFEVTSGAQDVVVDVRLDVLGPAALVRLLPPITMDARAVAARELS